MCIEKLGDDLIKNPIRRTRSKTRKPKFLSLRLELISPGNTLSCSSLMSLKDIHGGRRHQLQQQLNLFPLHPENMVDDRDCMNDENVAFIFNNDVGNTCNLQSFFPHYNNNTISVSSEEDSINFAYSEDGGGGGVGVGGGRSEADTSSLVRTAMRSRERDAIEEKWVCYSEVVEKKEPLDHAEPEELEVTSSAADEWFKKKKKIQRQLSLKLDYQGILKAWSDKAPLYIQRESPQTVPNLQDDQTLHSDSFADRQMDGWGTDGNVWKVPEMGAIPMKKEDSEAKEGLKMAQREASVMRYKEKRQSRLFSKRIRYEVRKLNAEKRPRMKGRFVKRN